MLDLERKDWRCSWLDLLRTFLALYVVFTHSISWQLARGDQSVTETIAWRVNDWINRVQSSGGTNVAVLTFIVLSGYCIHRSGLGGDIKQYAARRAFRILPIYIAATFFGVAVFLSLASPFPFVKSASATTDISAACVFIKLTTVASILPWLKDCSYAGNANITTVAVEMWLYAAYPLGLLLVRKRGERWLWAILLLITVVGFTVSLLGVRDLHWWRNSSFAGYLLFWWMGAKAVDPKGARLFQKASPFVFVLWLLLWGTQLNALVEVRQLCVAALAAALIPALDRPWHSPAIEVAGRAGYSIYAFHAPISYALIAVGLTWHSALLASAVFGLAAFYVIELPFERVGRRLRQAISLRQQRREDIIPKLRVSV